jgi:hypothetical protein
MITRNLPCECHVAIFTGTKQKASIVTLVVSWWSLLDQIVREVAEGTRQIWGAIASIDSGD